LTLLSGDDGKENVGYGCCCDSSWRHIEHSIHPKRLLLKQLFSWHLPPLPAFRSLGGADIARPRCALVARSGPLGCIVASMLSISKTISRISLGFGFFPGNFDLMD
jgi:hypothetical protein